jgi:hypothetical protein
MGDGKKEGWVDEWVGGWMRPFEIDRANILRKGRRKGYTVADPFQI